MLYQIFSLFVLLSPLGDLKHQDYGLIQTGFLLYTKCLVRPNQTESEALWTKMKDVKSVMSMELLVVMLEETVRLPLSP